MLYGSETWAANTEQVARLSRAEMRMVRCMCGVTKRERKTNAELRKSLGIKDIDEVMRRSRLRWMGHVLRKDKDDWVRRSMEMVIEGKRGVGRPKMTWVKAVESDMRVKGLMKGAEDRKNGGLCHGEQKVNSYNSRKNSLKTCRLWLLIYI